MNLAPCRATLTPETERLLVGPLKAVMDHISEAFLTARRRNSVSSSNAMGVSTIGASGSRVLDRMEWGKEGLGAWVASLAEQVQLWSRTGGQASFRRRPVGFYVTYAMGRGTRPT